MMAIGGTNGEGGENISSNSGAGVLPVKGTMSSSTRRMRGSGSKTQHWLPPLVGGTTTLVVLLLLTVVDVSDALRPLHIFTKVGRVTTRTRTTTTKTKNKGGRGDNEGAMFLVAPPPTSTKHHGFAPRFEQARDQQQRRGGRSWRRVFTFLRDTEADVREQTQQLQLGATGDQQEQGELHNSQSPHPPDEVPPEEVSEFWMHQAMEQDDAVEGTEESSSSTTASAVITTTPQDGDEEDGEDRAKKIVAAVLQEYVADGILSKEIQKDVPKDTIQGVAASAVVAGLVLSKSLTAAAASSLVAAYLAITPGKPGDALRLLGGFAYEGGKGALSLWTELDGNNIVKKLATSLFDMAVINTKRLDSSWNAPAPTTTDTKTLAAGEDEEDENEDTEVVDEDEGKKGGAVAEVIDVDDDSIVVDEDLAKVLEEAAQAEREADMAEALLTEAREKRKAAEVEAAAEAAEEARRVEAEERARLAEEAAAAERAKMEEEEATMRKAEEAQAAEAAAAREAAEEAERARREAEVEAAAEAARQAAAAEAEAAERARRGEEAALRRAEEEAGRLEAERAARRKAEEDASRLEAEKRILEARLREVEAGKRRAEEEARIASEAAERARLEEEARLRAEQEEWEASVRLARQLDGTLGGEAGVGAGQGGEVDPWGAAAAQGEGEVEQEVAVDTSGMSQEELGRMAREAVAKFEAQRMEEVSMMKSGDEYEDEDEEDEGVYLETDLEYDDDEPPAAMPLTDWSAFTVAQLKDELRIRGLRLSGRKAELIARLEEHESS